MNFRAVHNNQEWMYALGIDEDTGDYVLEVLAGRVGMYLLYFRLTLEEYHNYPANAEQIHAFAKSCMGGVNDSNPNRRIDVRGG